ncbi:MAG: histidine kinase [Chloroflexi bacterium]|nr:histidine kinase [Chloroflexota bacterium]
MDNKRQLDLIQRLGQLLLSAQPLPHRLTQVLEQLQSALPFEVARVIVLDESASWSLAFPPHAPGTSQNGADALWSNTLTGELFHLREPIQRPIDQRRCYVAWPIGWQSRLYGALELQIQQQDSPAPELMQVIQALLPIFATALSQSQGANGQPILSLAEQQRLDTIATQIQSPLLLQPLLADLLSWSVEHTAASNGSIHVAEANGHGLHLLTFELPHQENSPSTALVPSTRAHDLAKIALANGRAMIRQVDGLTHFAAPIVHNGQLLGAIALEGAKFQSQALLFVQRLAELAGPAVVRAQFYQQLADAGSHLQQVFDELPTGLALTDANGTLLRANPSWWQLWSIDPTVIPAIKLIPWDMLPHVLARLPDPLAFSDLFTKPITTATEALVVMQGPWQELRLLLMPVRDMLGLQSGFLLAANDVTREREVDRLKSEFVSVVSHELRTPLTSILGYTELLLAREFAPAERREFIHTVHKEADHLANLVEDLLNVSRLDAGKIKLERWVMALPKLVRELVAQLNAELDVERHRLLLDVPESLPPIYADRDRVRQILSNLLSNAIKYSPEGGEVVLHASVLQKPPASAPSLPPEPALLISVRDQGIGIPQHELSRIFERFYRVDNSNTRRIGGTGLGLAITRALVELHGGRIWVESTPGEGSTFYVTLPLATEMLRTRR